VYGKLLLKTYADGSQRKYYYDGIRVILEKSKPAQGSWTTSKVYTLGGGDIGFIIAERDYSGGTPTNKWYHYDRLGNVMAFSNSGGTPLTYSDQDAFGNVTDGSPSGYHLTTKDNHTDVGLYYFYQRWYDPLLGRFTQVDPVRSVNRYVYCKNNPANRTDPSGLMTEEDCSEVLNKICVKMLGDNNTESGDCASCVTLCNQAANDGKGVGVGAGIFVQTCRRQCASERTEASILAECGKALEPGRFNPGAPTIPIPYTPPGTPGIPIPLIPRGGRP